MSNSPSHRPRVNPEIFHAKVYDICRQIPYGQVTSYGHIAKLAGYPSHARLVGQALRFLSDPQIPWHRVISSSGTISERGDGGEAASRQAQRLIQEGIQLSHNQRGQGVSINHSSKWRVNLMIFGWFPNQVVLERYSDDDDDDSELSDPPSVSDEEHSTEAGGGG